MSREIASALSIGRPTLDAEAIVPGSRSSPKPTGRRMDHDRHIELGRELEERQALVVVG